MSCENLQFTEAERIEPDEIQLACLEEVGFADEPVQKFETIPTEKMSPRDIPAKGGQPAKKLYVPSKPPEPKYTIDKAQIKPIDPSDISKGHTWQFNGKIEGDDITNCTVTAGWSGKPANLKLEEMTTIYSAPGAKQTGKDIAFIGAHAAVGRNTESVSRFPTHDPNRFGYDCEIKRVPIPASAVDDKDKSGHHLVYLSRAFVNMGGLVADRTVDHIGDKDYKHFYATQVQRFEKLVDGKPVGLKQVSFYADRNGDTTQKVQDEFYTVEYGTDAKGQPTVNSRLNRTVVYNPDTATPKEITEYAQYKGATVISKKTEHDFQNQPGSKRVTDMNLEDQRFSTCVLSRPDKTPVYTMERNLKDKTTLTININDGVDLGPGFGPGSSTVIMKQASDKSYYIDSMEIREGSRKIVDIKPPNGELKFKYEESRIVGVEGAEFYRHGQKIPDAILARMFKDRQDLHDSWLKLTQ